MNILFLTLNTFASINQHGIYTDLLREFARNNHNLFIVTPVEKSTGEETLITRAGNINILKLRIGNIQKTNLLEKGISTLSLESSYKKGIKKYFHDVKFDLVLYSTPPITLYKSVQFVKKKDGAKTYLLLKDIFPQNAVDLGMLKDSGLKKFIYRYFRNKEIELYKISDHIGCMSKANVDYLLKNNPQISKERVEVCPNTIEPQLINITATDKKNVREKYAIPENKTVFVYGGNLGKPQGVDFLIHCLRANEVNENSYFCIVGSGTEFGKIEQYFKNEKPKNARLLSQLPKEDYEILVHSADVGLLFLDNRFTIPNFPSRLLSYMQASLPILAATDVNTDIGDTIEGGKFGYWCESVDVTRFNQLVNKLCNEELRIELGKNARTYLEEHYTAKHAYNIIMKHFTNKN